jgi:hypothetical protein
MYDSEVLVGALLTSALNGVHWSALRPAIIKLQWSEHTNVSDDKSETTKL